MPRMIFLNLPVEDLAASTRFYEAIGCRINEAFSDAKASSMVWSDTITFQLLQRDYFASFAPKPVANSLESCAVLVALSRDTREEVDAIVSAAAAAGGTSDVRVPIDMGWLYNRAFQDPSGHVYEAVWMDMSGPPASS